MIETKFTPGPWCVGHTEKPKGPYQGPRVPVHVGAFENRGNCFAIVYHGGRGATQATVEDAEANARLIAAAPDLFAACVAALEFAEESGEDLGANHWPDLRAAIERATETTQ